MMQATERLDAVVVPPVVFDEAADDVATFAAGAYDADWERKVWQ